MASIRSFNTNLPHVFRFPKWTAGIFYPSGSIVLYEHVDNGVVEVEYYVAVSDVNNLTDNPKINTTDWNVVFDDPIIDSDVMILLNDSDFVQTLVGAGDLINALDSEEHARKAIDSDIRTEADDLLRRIYDNDSDIAVLQAASSLINDSLDSEIRARLSADSDFQVTIIKAVHDYLSNDSEIDSDTLDLKRRMDSDFDAAVRGWNTTGNEYAWAPQPFISNTDFFIDQRTITNHTSGYLWLIDHQNGFAYIIRDGVQVGNRAPANLSTTSINVGIEGVFTRGTQITDSGGGADVNVFQSNTAPLPIATNANLYTVQEREKALSATATPTLSMDDALRRTIATVIDMDSDLLAGTKGNDSDHRVFYHDIEALDSEIAILKSDRDSDTKAIQHLQLRVDSEGHAWRAADSDLRFEVLGDIDSDIRELKDNDSDLFVKLDSEEEIRRNADSDIYNKYTSVHFRYIKREYEPAVIAPIPTPTIDYNGVTNAIGIQNCGNSIWVWNVVNQVLTIIDSDGTQLYNEVHGDEPIVVYDPIKKVEYHRRTDTGSNVAIEIDGVFRTTDDIWNYEKIYSSSVDDNGGRLEAIIDSDLNLHEWDSDNTDTLVWLGEYLSSANDELEKEIHDRKAADSDILLELDSEIHDRKAADSDLHVGALTTVRVVDWDYKQLTAYDGTFGVDRWFFNGATGGTNGTGFGGLPLNSRLGVQVTGEGGRRLNATVVSDNTDEMGTQTGTWITVILDGEIIVAAHQKDYEGIIVTRSNVVRKPYLGSNNKWYIVPNNELYNRRSGDTGYYDVQEVEPIFELIQDSDYKTKEERDRITNETIKNLYWRDLKLEIKIDSDILHTSDSDRHDWKAADSDIIAEFRIPEETITLASGTEVYTLTNTLLNEVTRWSFRSEIQANSSIYNGIVNDHFEINHNGTAWEIEVDGVQGREYVDIFVSGSATSTGQSINIPWDDNSTVTISPLSTDSTASIATQLYEALLDKAVSATLNTTTSSVNYSADGRINPTGTITLNGISFTFLENNVVDEGFYYKDADTITIRKK